MGTELHAAEAFVFDLDDTLADTSGTLLDAALGRAAGALAAHLPADAPTLHDELREESAHRDGRDVFAGVAKRYPVERERTAVAVAAAREAYRSSPPDAIRLLPGARELLESLSTRCRLYLLTAGYAPTQRRKIELLGLARHFDAVDAVGVRSTPWVRARGALREVAAVALYGATGRLATGR